MTSPIWEVLLPAEIDPAGPELLSDIATTIGIDNYDDRAALLDDVDRFNAIVTRT